MDTTEISYSPSIESLSAEIGERGFCFLPGADTRPLLDAHTLTDWSTFAASWDGMPLDTYMADGGRYRRRRYATLSLGPGARAATLEASQPHYQSRDYNALNGGIARHYEPIPDGVIRGPVFTALIGLCADAFGALSPGHAWHVEAHQFRIEADARRQGLPTPEGVHRDGVDYVMVMMVQRHNIVEGTTTIHGVDKAPLASFTLTEPLDMTLLDDRRCLHGVTPVVPADPGQPAYRDVLVITFRDKGGAAST